VQVKPAGGAIQAYQPMPNPSAAELANSAACWVGWIALEDGKGIGIRFFETSVGYNLVRKSHKLLACDPSMAKISFPAANTI
jgi:hypothetical protein